MASNDSDTEALMRAVATGNVDARGVLLERYRDRLTRMVSIRLDPRVVPRLDASDVVAEAIAVADGKLEGYLADPPIPFYLWIRKIAWERMIQLHRHHLAQRRSVGREVRGEQAQPDGSAAELTALLVGSGTSPSENAIREEMRVRVGELMSQLPARDREVLVMYYLEQLSMTEIALALGLSEGAVKMRHLRALERIRKLGEANA